MRYKNRKFVENALEKKIVSNLIFPNDSSYGIYFICDETVHDLWAENLSIFSAKVHCILSEKVCLYLIW